MNRKNYIILCITLVVTGVMVLFSVTDVSADTSAAQEEKPVSGYAGEWKMDERTGKWSQGTNITWMYDAATKTLSFSGTGEMMWGAAYDLNSDKVVKKLETWHIWKKETEHVVIGEGIIDIGIDAFLDFWKLEDVSIPESVQYIRSGAFKNTGLKSITIPGSVREIGSEAFMYASLKGTSITIPGSVKKIGYSAFEETFLKEITIENGVEEIYEGAFRSCWLIEEIIFPESVKFVTSNSKLTSAGYGMLDNCNHLKKVTLPSTITSIPASFCCECYSLEKISIPQSVKIIGVGAFSECYSLEKISIPQSVRIIGEGAFDSCTSLKKIIIPQSVKIIGAFAFNECTSLEKVILPQSLKRIEDFSFADTALKGIKLPKSLKEIGLSAFEDTPLKSIKLPKSLEKIEGTAFAGTSLKTIEIPKNVKVLGSFGESEGVFPGNKKFRTVKIKSKKLKKIYEGTFKNFPSKAVIIVPKGKKESYSKMFYKAGLSKKVKIKESKTW